MLSKIWNAVNGDELLTFEHDRVVKVAIFSANSEFVYTGGADGVLRKFSLYSQGEPFLLSISGLKGSICAVVSIENGNFLWIASSENQSIYVWDARTNTLVGELFTDSEICSMEYSAARATVLVSTKNEIQLWDALNRSVIHRFAIPSLEIQCAALHPTKPIVAVGSFNELYARVYDLSGQELSCLKGHHGPVRSLAFSPADDVLATGSEDGTIRFWSMSSDR